LPPTVRQNQRLTPVHSSTSKLIILGQCDNAN
jgi:hypothetical protein